MNLYLIEHPTKGVLTDLPYDRDEKAHFAWSISRRDERAKRLTLPEARRALPILPEGCYILDLEALEEVTT